MLEVLLVLCLMAALAALAAPALERPLANQRLAKAADLVRAQWTRARSEAIELGQVRAFRCALQGNAYRLEWLNLDGSGISADNSNSTSNSNSDSSTPGPTQVATQRTLPDGVSFAALTSGVPSADPNSAATSASSPAASSSDDGSWSDPVLFYPDGSASNALVTLVNRNNRTVDVRLRGLTGVVLVGDVQAGGGKP